MLTYTLIPDGKLAPNGSSASAVLIYLFCFTVRFFPLEETSMQSWVVFFDKPGQRCDLVEIKLSHRPLDTNKLQDCRP